MTHDATYRFCGGYILDDSGDKWWSAELLARTERERDAAQTRARRACQILVEETGADGPIDVDTAAERAAALIRELRDQVAVLTAAQEESEHQMHMRIRSGYDKTIADAWRAKVAEVEAERDEAQADVKRLRARVRSVDRSTAYEGSAFERDDELAEIEMLRGVGCREQKVDEPESGPCGACLRCAEERGAKWALDSVGWSHEDDRWAIAERVCRDARSK